MTTRRGFTLVEVLIGSTLAAVIMVAVFSTFIFLGRNLARLANYQSLEAKDHEATAYLGRDLALAQSVKTGTTPTASAVTLVLPAGEVTYTFDSVTSKLRRQANFGTNRDVYLLTDDYSTCTSFAFDYRSASGGSAVSQITAGAYVPYSVKQIEFRYTLSSPTGFALGTRSTYDSVSPWYVIRNRQLPDGS